MSTRTVVDCDRCGKECETFVRLAIPNGIKKQFGGPEGVEIDQQWEDADLCVDCCAAMLRFVMRHKLDEDGRPRNCGRFQSRPNASNNLAIRLMLRFLNRKELH